MPLCSFNWRFQMEISVLEGMASHRFKMIQTVLSIQRGVLGTWDQKPCQTCQGWPTKDVLPNRSLETCGRVRIQHDATSFNEYASSYSLLFWGAFLMPGICAIWIHLDSVCFPGFVVRPSNAELRQLHMLNGPDMDKSNVQQGIRLGSFRQSRNVFFRILHGFLCFSQWCLRCGNACIWSSTMRQPLPRLLQRFWGHPMPVVCDSCRLK